MESRKVLCGAMTKIGASFRLACEPLTLIDIPPAIYDHRPSRATAPFSDLISRVINISNKSNFKLFTQARSYHIAKAFSNSIEHKMLCHSHYYRGIYQHHIRQSAIKNATLICYTIIDLLFRFCIYI